MADCSAASSSSSTETFLCGENGCMEEFASVGEHEVHYEEVHRHHCSRCGQRFSSNHRLEIHLEENHDPFFQSLSKTNPMFRCYSNDCESKFMTSNERNDHSVDSHGLLDRFDLDKRKRPTKMQPVSTSSSSTAANRLPTNRKSKGNVPRSVCFGGGTEKSFDIAALRKPWHQRQRPAASENALKPIECADLAAALKSDLNQANSIK
uniref:C2H2-type domain-containing protein n=1 Tax=Plectus sambesii TaxID=2011161 RepID=A0A914X4U2_9BILA